MNEPKIEIATDTYQCRMVETTRKYIQAAFDTQGVQDAIQLCDYYIDAIGREIEAVISFQSLAFQKGVDARELYCLPTGIPLNRQEKIVSADSVNVAAMPWSRVRLCQSFRDVYQNGFLLENGLPRGIFYEELNLIILSERHHHTAAARYMRRSLRVQADCISIEPTFSQLRVNQDLRWCNAQGVVYDSIPDSRMAFLYEIARWKFLLSAGEFPNDIGLFPVLQQEKSTTLPAAPDVKSQKSSLPHFLLHAFWKTHKTF